MTAPSAEPGPVAWRWVTLGLYAMGGGVLAFLVAAAVELAVPSLAAAPSRLAAVDRLVFLVAGLAMGSAGVGRLRHDRTVTGGSRVAAALLIGLGLAGGREIGARAGALADTRDARSGVESLAMLAGGLLGAGVAARGRFGPPPSPDDPNRPPSPPLTVGQHAAVQQALSVLDRLQAFHARVAAPEAAAPDEVETARFFDAAEEYSAKCGLLPSDHDVMRPLREAGETLAYAVEMRYVAHGWHARLEVAPGDADGVTHLARRYQLDADEPGQMAERLLARSHAARDAVQAIAARALTSV